MYRETGVQVKDTLVKSAGPPASRITPFAILLEPDVN